MSRWEGAPAQLMCCGSGLFSSSTAVLSTISRRDSIFTARASRALVISALGPYLPLYNRTFKLAAFPGVNSFLERGSEGFSLCPEALQSCCSPEPAPMGTVCNHSGEARTLGARVGFLQFFYCIFLLHMFRMRLLYREFLSK